MVNLAVIGIGNFGRTHVDAGLRMAEAGLARFVAAADVRLNDYPEAAERLRAHGVACYIDHAEMLAAHPELDLVTLPLPIPLHAPMAIECMERGLHVLVEKPPAPTAALVQRMIDTAQRTGKLCGIAYQWSTSNMFLAISDVIASGKIGRVTDVAVLCHAQRQDWYYARTPWAGKLRLNGAIVHDGTLNNPFAHQVQNLLSFGGVQQGRGARPVQVTAELYAGHDIESEDTSCLRATLDSGVTMRFYASLCTHDPWSIEVRITGTEGTIVWHDSKLVEGEVRLADGTVEPLPVLAAEDGGTQVAMFRDIIEVIEGRKPRLACPVEDTLGFAQTIDMAFKGERVTHLHGTPHARREAADDPAQTCTYIEGIEETLRAAFDSGKLFSEMNLPWAAVPLSVMPG